MFESDHILLIMRHAKSDWPSYLARDFDRPLDPRGEQQPPVIAHQLNALGINIDHALISPALRTTQTFELLAQKLAKSPQPFFDPRLYNAHCQDALDVLREHDGCCRSLLVIGHNPSVSELTYNLTKSPHDFKTANLAILRAKKNSLGESLAADFGFSLEKILIPRPYQ